MSLYRVKQFFWCIFSSITEEDVQFTNKYLNDEERSIFHRLSKGEMKHSIRVAKDIEKNYEEVLKGINIDIKHRNQLVKIALLHDIGKVVKRLNVIDKSLLVILNKITKGKISKYKNLEKVNVYFNHGAIGVGLLKELGYDEYWLWVVKNHHNRDIKDNSDICILRYFDNIY